MPSLIGLKGTPFTAPEFRNGTGNGIKHALSPPHYPASIGEVEGQVQNLKNALRKMLSEGGETSFWKCSATSLVQGYSRCEDWEITRGNDLRVSRYSQQRYYVAKVLP